MINIPQSSFGSSAEFQSSALPWVTSSNAPTTPERWDFAKVTRFVTVRNNGTGSSENIAFGFTHLGVQGTNYFQVPAGQSQTFEVRVKHVFVMSLDTGAVPYSLFAGLTTVDSNNMPRLSGSLPNGDPGWDGVG